VPQHWLAAHKAILLRLRTASTAACACGDDQSDSVWTRSHLRALATADLLAKLKAGNGLPKF
jgi:hypothetical protein